MIEEIKKYMPDADSIDIREIPPLTLAYIGDSIMDLFIRTYFATSTHETVSKLNNRAVKIVNASAQAKILLMIEEKLTDEEKDIVRRGRNAKSQTSPKNQSITDYRHATGLEALLGWLFIMKREDRIAELLSSVRERYVAEESKE